MIINIRPVSTRAWYAVVGGAVLVLVGLFALRFPVYLDAFDQWGWQVRCGTGLSADSSQAASATDAARFVPACDTAVLVRRLWSVPMVALGVVAFFGTLLATALRELRGDVPARATGN